VVFTQLAFVGHDAGHRQIFGSRRANDLVGLFHANLLVGVSFGWWVGKHNRHHSNPDHEGLDPDISITALAFTADQASSKHGLVRMIARHQAYLPGWCQQLPVGRSMSVTLCVALVDARPGGRCVWRGPGPARLGWSGRWVPVGSRAPGTLADVRPA
jgi:Fatty acid desaturase